jgi:hypothetical protein
VPASLVMGNVKNHNFILSLSHITDVTVPINH